MRRPGIGFQWEALQLGVETSPGVDLFVDTVRGATGAQGLSWASPLSTVEGAFERLDVPKYFSAEFKKNATIWIMGDVREQFNAPDGLYGVKIRGAANGRARHSTSGGTVVDGNGASWRQSSSVEGQALLRIEGQGYEFHNILFVPESGYAAVQLLRTATDTVDASHSVFKNCKFISPGTRVGYGLEDNGGAYRIQVEDCEFVNLEFAWKQTSVSIASPSAHIWRKNIFDSCKTDIAGNFVASLFEGNYFLTKYDATTHPTTLNLASTSDAGSATRKNIVKDNIFADAAADVTIAKGYKPATGDIWRNFVTDTAAYIVTVPA